MQKLTFAFLLALSTSTSVYAKDTNASLTLAHESTVYANRGICSAKISYIIDDYIEDVLALDLNLVAKDPKGKIVFSEKINQPTSEMNAVGGKTYGEFFLEDESICDSEKWSLEVISAKFIFKDGHASKDLIKSKQVFGSAFKPMTIRIRSK